MSSGASLHQTPPRGFFLIEFSTIVGRLPVKLARADDAFIAPSLRVVVRLLRLAAALAQALPTQAAVHFAEQVQDALSYFLAELIKGTEEDNDMGATVIETVVSSDHLFHLPEELPVGCAVKITVEPIVHDEFAERYQPRSDIGRLALAARRPYIEGGGKLLSWDEINDEVRRRRGGAPDE